MAIGEPPRAIAQPLRWCGVLPEHSIAAKTLLSPTLYSSDHRTMKTKPRFALANKTHARVLFTVSILMCAMAIAAICVAEVFMPENAGGQKGLVAFYRWFGSCLVIQTAVAVWTYGQLKRLA